MSILTDAFPGTDPGAVWQLGPGGGATVAYTSGEAVVTLPSNGAKGSEGAFTTSRYYDLRNDSVSVEVTSAGNTATSAYANLTIRSSGSDYFEITQEGGTLSAVTDFGGNWVVLKSTTYSPTTHRYWRIRESAGTTYFETSPDGATWAILTQTSSSTLFPLDYVQVQLGGGTHGGEVSPGTVNFDNVNGGVASTEKWCPISSITDDFSATTRGLQWARSWTSAPETATQTGGQLVFTLVSNGTEYAQYVSASSYDLTGSAILIQVPTIPNPATQAQAYLALAAPGKNQVQMMAMKGQLEVTDEVGGTDKTIGAQLYDTVQHAWWRIRESGGTLFFETAPDGKTWVVQQQISPLPFPVDVVDVYIGSGTWVAEASPGAPAFDNVNLPPP